jgi:hypothetical protein
MLPLVLPAPLLPAMASQQSGGGSGGPGGWSWKQNQGKRSWSDAATEPDWRSSGGASAAASSADVAIPDEPVAWKGRTAKERAEDLIAQDGRWQHGVDRASRYNGWMSKMITSRTRNTLGKLFPDGAALKNGLAELAVQCGDQAKIDGVEDASVELKIRGRSSAVAGKGRKRAKRLTQFDLHVFYSPKDARVCQAVHDVIYMLLLSFFENQGGTGDEVIDDDTASILRVLPPVKEDHTNYEIFDVRCASNIR